MYDNPRKGLYAFALSSNFQQQNLVQINIDIATVLFCPLRRKLAPTLTIIHSVNACEARVSGLYFCFSHGDRDRG